MGERWLGMREPVSLEEYAEAADRRMRELPDQPMDLSDLAAAPHIPGSLHTAAAQRAQRQFDPVKGLLATKPAMSSPAVSEAVTVQATRPGKGEYQVRAYFTNPANLGGFAGPLPAAHIGFKVYRGDEFLYALDAGPSGPNFNDPRPGKLIFNGTDKNLTSYQPGIAGAKEFPLTPPQGVSGEMFAKQLLHAAREYDGSLPYSLPIEFDTHYILDPTTGAYGQDFAPTLYVRNHMKPGEYNSNSFAAALLNRTGATSGISDLQRQLAASKLAAPGLEQPVPQEYFRNR